MASLPNQFQPVTTPAPDWSAPVNWSEKEIPAAGSAAIIAGTTAAVDPDVTLSAALALEPGSSGIAALVGNGGAFTLGDTATLAIGNALGAVTGQLFAADSLVNQGLISIGGTGAALDVVVDLGAITGQADGPAPSFSNQGLISVSQGGVLEVAGTAFRNAGSIMLDAGTLEVSGGAIGDTGYIQLDHAATARFSDGVEFQHFDFGSQGGTISLDDPWIGQGVTLSGFGAGDEIELAGQQSGQIEIGANALTLLNGSGAAEGVLNLAAPLAPDLHFAMVSAASGSAIIAEADPPCFAAGSCILTPSGYVPVEALGPGDAVITTGGGTAAILWTGCRTVEVAAHPRPDAVRPVRILPGALGTGTPRRALRLSPDHALHLGGVLIPVKHLVNGATIIRETDCRRVTYHHLELARHGVILAEAAPCETYLDTGNRGGFANGGASFGRTRRWDHDAFAPLCVSGPALRAVRQHLLDRVRALGFTPRILSGVTVWIDGARMRQTGMAAARPRFALPARHGGRAAIRSASFVPAEFDASSDDRRRLGIALAGISLAGIAFGPDAACETPAIRGFHPRAEGDGAIWTDGNGEIALPARARSLTLHVAALPQAWARPDLAA